MLAPLLPYIVTLVALLAAAAFYKRAMAPPTAADKERKRAAATAWVEDWARAKATDDAALRTVPAVEGHCVMGLSADMVEALLRCLEPELVAAARERRARELLGLSRSEPAPTAEQCVPHASELGLLALADAIGYDLWTVAPQVSRRYAALPNGDRPALVEILLGDAERTAGLAPAAAARGVRAKANCFLSWHMAAKLLELLEAQRTQQEKDGAPIFVWNNLFMIRQVSAAPTDFGAIFGTTVPLCGFTLAFLDPWDAPSMLTRIWCLAEIYHTVRHGCRLDVAMSAEGRVAFEQALVDDFGSITTALSKINVKKAEASRPGEYDEIMTMVEAGVGCQRLNELVLKQMRAWVAGAGRAALAALPQAKRATSVLLNQVALLLQDQGRLDEARPLLEEALVGSRAALGDAHPDTLTSVNNLGMLLQAQGQLDEARPLLEEVLARRRRACVPQGGSWRPAEVFTRANFASVDELLVCVHLPRAIASTDKVRIAPQPFAGGACRLVYHGQVQAGGNTKAMVFKEFKQEGAGVHDAFNNQVEVSTVAAFLAGIYNHSRARFAGDLPIEFLSARMVEVQQGEGRGKRRYCMEAKLPGGQYTKWSNNTGFWNHTSTTEECKTLARFSRYTYAVTHGHIMVVDLQGVLAAADGGKERRFVLTDPVILCKDLGRFGNTNMGPGFFKRCLDSAKRCLDSAALACGAAGGAALGDTHLDTLTMLTSVNNLGLLLQAQGQLDEAQPLLEEALKGNRSLLGGIGQQPSLLEERTLASVNNLGMLRLDQGRLDEARPLLEEALVGYRALKGDTCPDTLASVNNLGSLLQAQGQQDEARPLLKEALAGRRVVLGDTHLDTLTSIGNLGSLLQDQGRLDEARPLLEEVLAGHRMALGDTHPKTLGSVNNLGMLLVDQGRLEEARPLLEEDLAGERAMHGECHPDVLNASGNLGMLLVNAGALDEGLPLVEAALAGIRSARGEEHPHVRKFAKGLEELRCRRAAQGQPEQ
jgi:tetratricopeptide (TPR) repeat protein